ncbi:MAG: hypothetical protein LBU65_06035 [Planctomycetaceae bacterium]|nr:hypothetical protein [Planctomycetaceae bacterium]
MSVFTKLPIFAISGQWNEKLYDFAIGVQQLVDALLTGDKERIIECLYKID